MVKYLYEYFGLDDEGKCRVEEKFLPGDIVFVGKRGRGVRGVVFLVKGNKAIVYIPKSGDLTPLKLARIIVDNPDKVFELRAKGKVVRKEVSLKELEYDFSPVHMYLRDRKERRGVGKSSPAEVVGVVESFSEKGWEWKSGELIVGRKRWVEDLKMDLVVEEGRRIEKIRVFCEGERVYDYYPDPAEPEYRVVGYEYRPVEVWVYIEGFEDVEVFDYDEFKFWLKKLFGLRVMEYFDNLILGLLEEISEESWEFVDEEEERVFWMGEFE